MRSRETSMETEQALFVGGPADRTWRTIPEGRDTYDIAEIPVLPYPPREPPSYALAAPVSRRHRYRRETLWTESRLWVLYISEDLTIPEAYARIFGVYSQLPEQASP